jgi:hypothetical protein
MAFDIPATIMDPLVLLIIAIIGFITAYIQKIGKDQAEAKTTEVVAFYDPEDNSSMKPPSEVQARSWKMSDSTKRWLTFDLSPEDAASALKQVEDAERLEKVSYTINLPNGWYEIEYGLMKGGGKTG